jgi:hypothetical protein
MDELLKPLSKKNILEPGTIIRRIGSGKDQQGSFLEFDESYNMILVNIIDMKTGSLLASEGVLKPQEGDKLYYYPTTFSSSSATQQALKIIKEWPLYKKHEVLQDKIINFISISYSPEQIINLSKTESLNLVFVPVQQKFRIGRFNERRNMARVCNDGFMLWLEAMNTGKHITYLAMITHIKNRPPRFYSAGDKSHDKTAKQLGAEAYKFDPTHGGQIKAAGVEKGKKHFIVDAGSQYMGLGVRTPLSVATVVTDTLKKIYPEFVFTPVEGQGAV